MKIAAFYENIVEGAWASGVSLESAVRDLMQEGLELLYISGFAYKDAEDEIERLIKSTGVGVEGMYMFYDFGENPEDQSYEWLIDTTKRIGGTNVLLIPGMLQPEDSEKEKKIANMVCGMRRAAAYGREKGIDVSMEDFDGPDAPFCTIDGLAYFLQNVPGLTCSFDTGNFIMEHEDELEAFELFKDQICTMHLKDRAKEGRYPDVRSKACKDGALEYPTPVGQGYIRMKEILDRLKEMNYQGNLIVEMYDYSPVHMLEGIRESVCWVKKTIS